MRLVVQETSNPKLVEVSVEPGSYDPVRQDCRAFRIDSLFKSAGCSLADVYFEPFKREARDAMALLQPHAAATWLGRLSLTWSCSKSWLLTFLHKEHSWLSYSGKVNPHFSWRPIRADEKPAAGEHVVATKGGTGWVAIRGQKRWYAATGYAWPFCGRAYFATERYLGFARQTIESAQWTYRRAAEWRVFEAKKNYPRLLLEPFDKGVKAICKTELAYFMIRYTPSLDWAADWIEAHEYVEQLIRKYAAEDK